MDTNLWPVSKNVARKGNNLTHKGYYSSTPTEPLRNGPLRNRAWASSYHYSLGRPYSPATNFSKKFGPTFR